MVTLRAQQEFAREGNYLPDELRWGSQALQLSEVTSLDLLESLKYGLFLAHTFLIKRLLFHPEAS